MDDDATNNEIQSLSSIVGRTSNGPSIQQTLNAKTAKNGCS